MDAESFAQQFITAYGIPELKPQQRPMIIEGLNLGTLNYWEYRSPEGFLVTIGQDKSVRIAKIPKQAEREFD
jgi:hypothetical protein